jgi:hypothetical protein
VEKVSISTGKPFDFDVSLKDFYQDKTKNKIVLRCYETPASKLSGSYLSYDFIPLRPKDGIFASLQQAAGNSNLKNVLILAQVVIPIKKLSNEQRRSGRLLK